MATTTPNLGLVKPDYEDLADIAVLNDNSDTIDAAIKAVQDSVSQDTGWVDITSGVSYCVKLGVCHLKMSGVSIPAPNSQLVVARLPQGARPKTGGTTTQVFFRIGTTLCQAWITTDGNIRVDATVSGTGAGFATFPVA